ncbi:UNVERIFIED_CONTAM: Retrovirus-related Pol polyprotein from transposon TNT 1-94 [Sesamum radiatum]|uniref:Retrovirus-related Pol polyprotein from transposon TNT 1-94 n=1 Tax=Sesamum radiatum TaxID=300843 RepID=A0AAW2T2E6_SESRA
MVSHSFDSKVKPYVQIMALNLPSLPCQELFHKHGILHQKSCTYTPQQNGVVERKHRHLLEVARALMFESGLPREFWGDSILTATHIINKLPSPKLNWKSPFEILHKTPPSYNNLRTFGCLCYASNVIPHKSKFDHRAYKGVFIGYVQGQKGYKIYDILNCKSPDPTPDESSPSLAPTTDLTLPTTQTSLQPTTQSFPSRPHRQTKPPAWLNDFFCNHASDSPYTTYAISPSHNDFLAVLSTIQEPNMVDLPKGKRAIGSKWVYKVKLNPNGSVDRYKARLVAKGYNQVEGVDYIDRFSPVAKAVTVRTLLAVASSYAWPIHQVDINNAFLHGFLEEDIYMLPPDGYSVPAGKVCKLRRSLYGLKQASRQWNRELTDKLLGYGFSQSPHDHCLFTKNTDTGLLILLVYVDDVLLTGPSISQINAAKEFLDSEFTIKNLGPAKYFLGLEIARSTAGTSVTQHKYIRDILKDTGLATCKPTSTPLPLGLKLLCILSTII